MLNKEQYKEAQKIARNLKGYASANRWNNNSVFNMLYEVVGRFVHEISKLDCFAAEVANTIHKSMMTQRYQVARISDKQAWILAVAAVENNIKFGFDFDEAEEEENFDEE